MLERRDPAAHRWLLGGEVAAIREHGGRSLAEVAVSTGISKPKLGQLERGTYNVSPGELEAILRACGALDSEVDRLCALATRPRGRPWWYEWASIVPEWFQLYLGLEGMARSLFVYETAVVHGLLQTPAYARAVTAAASMVRPSDIERHVDLRMARAERLSDAEPLHYQAVMEEAALWRLPDDATVMRSQLDHLLAMSERPNVELRILPVRRQFHAGMTVGQFVLFEFDGTSPAAHSEIFGNARYTRNADRIRSDSEAARHLSAAALSAEKSRDLLMNMRKEL